MITCAFNALAGVPAGPENPEFDLMFDQVRLMGTFQVDTVEQVSQHVYPKLLEEALSKLEEWRETISYREVYFIRIQWIDPSTKKIKEQCYKDISPGTVDDTWGLWYEDTDSKIPEVQLSVSSNNIPEYVLPQRVHLPLLSDCKITPKHLPMGLGLVANPHSPDGFEENTVTWNTEESTHILISGTTGAGKSYLLNVLALVANKAGLKVDVIDVRFQGGNYIVAEGAGIINKLARNMDEAKQLLEEVGGNKLVIVDGILELIGSTGEQTPEQKEMERLLNRISSEYRQSGTHLAIAEQLWEIVMPTSWSDETHIVGGLLKNNCTARLLLGPASEEARKISLCYPDSTPRLVGKAPKGRGVYESGNGETGVLQVFALIDPDTSNLIAKVLDLP